AHSAGGRPGKLLSPARRRACIEQVRAQLHVSERRACAALGQHRSTQRKIPRGREDEERLTADIIELARQYGRYGYRKIAELLRQAGWTINDKRVERIWQREGLFWGNPGFCIPTDVPRPKSTSALRRVRASPLRQPVRARNFVAAEIDGQPVDARMAAPIAAYSSSVRRRLRTLSANRSTPLTGLSGRILCFTAH